ncbi:MAG: carbohydrate binding family 9 domain-containing protein [Saprospiraceae bacterium]|nr:carbohydrate binding family 9 domain-containing protein [Saprospiraceae bacterium]
MKKSACLFVGLIACFSTIYAKKTSDGPGDPEITKKQYFTQKLNAEIKFDGIPDDPAWDAVEWATDFVQYQPNDGAAPFHQTSFKILYDDKFLYLAYHAHDTSPDSIVQRMSRRDEFPGDWVEANIDSYHDQRTAFSFTLSVSGVRGDEFISNNGNNWDTSWNPIWFGKTNIDANGWTAEVKIPLSQLRYGDEQEKVWGIQVQRRIFRKEERSTWQHIPQNGSGWVSRFGELHGLKDIPSQRQIEIAPYGVAQLETYKKEEGNPFADGTDAKLTAGVDGKVAVTSDLIVDFTINPDFGQVEADPSQVRIDGFQNFFEERRPFFIESRNIFQYQLTGSAAEGEYDADLLFYSRRIGSSPHGYPNLDDGEYAKVPLNTSILGAAKFSGKTKDGWSIGILESMTQREKALIDLNGERRHELVEPLTSHFVGRLQKDINEGNTLIGGMFTAVNREKGMEDVLHRSAYTGGIDFQHSWKNRTWHFTASGIFSRVNGTKEAILNTQTAFEHLFQRPNADHVKVDPNRTSLTGHGGTIKLGKFGGKQGKLGQIFKFETGVTWRSPELEINDIGFLLTADEINHFTWVGCQFQKPFSVFRSARVNYNHWPRWDFGGQHLYQAFKTNMHAQLKSNWEMGSGLTWNPLEISNNSLRGGSSLRRPAGIGHFAYLGTDGRKKFAVYLNGFNAWGFDKTVRVKNLNIGWEAQPKDAFSIYFSTGVNSYFRKQDQYVDQVTYNGEIRTIVSEVHQKTLSFTLRLNYNITPDLTIQYYGQPFITRPLYKNFGYVIDPLGKAYDGRFHQYANSEISFADDSYLVDENGDGQPDYSFGNPDFNFVQFRSNFVVRWEYIAGSELYLVWSQSSEPDAEVFSDLGSNLGSSLLENSFGDKARNIFLVKCTYRFLR